MKLVETLFRIFVDRNSLEKTICFYESLYQEKCKLRFFYEEINLELAQVNCFLIISGSPEARKRYEMTKFTVIVESIYDAEKTIEKLGLVVLEKPKKVPTGLNMRVQHPDGSIVEYVELAR